MSSTVERRVKTLLVKKGVLTKEKVQEAVEITSKENKPLLEVLLDKFVDGPTLSCLIASQLKIPPISLDKFVPDKKVLENFSEEWSVKYNVLPLAKLGDKLTLVIGDPFDVVKLDDIRRDTKCKLSLVFALEKYIKEATPRFYHPEEDEDTKIEEMVSELGAEMELTEDKDKGEEDVDLSHLAEASGESPIIKLVNRIFSQALKDGATDIHIEPFEKKVRVRFRRDGLLQEVFFPPKRTHNAMISRIKIMAGMDIAERRLPQDGKLQLKYEGRRIDVRIGIIPTVHGERAALRILDSASSSISLEELGFEKESYAAFDRSINASYGMILVTGPTGSGKTTTLYCAIKEMFSPEDNFVTVEEPVEYQLEGITQVQIDTKQGRTFGTALRSILRQDPDVILIGEMRDFETADIGIKASITGHLVLSTLHTNDAFSTVARLVDMGIDPFMVSSALLLVTNQRLVRRLCPQCKEPAKIEQKRLLKIGFTPEETKTEIYQTVGCAKCFDGYRGRQSLYEVLEVDDEIRRLIIKNASALDIKDYAINKKGMKTKRRAGIAKVLKGVTTIDEILRVT